MKTSLVSFFRKTNNGHPIAQQWAWCMVEYQLIQTIILRAKCKTAVIPVYQQWSYCSLALSHRYMLFLCNSYAVWPILLYFNTALTHSNQDKLAAIFHTINSNTFSLMMMYEICLSFHWSLFLKLEITVFQHWLRKYLDPGQLTSHYLNQWWANILTHTYITQPQWFNNTHCALSDILLCPYQIFCIFICLPGSFKP